MNPIVNQLMNAALGKNPFLQMFQQIMVAKNPNAVMQSLMQQNPQLKQTMDYINQNGGNAEQLYYQKAKEMNTDPNVIINQLKNLMNNH